jgi:hypothetical protein
LISYLERAWPPLRGYLEERVTFLEDPEERSSYRGLFNAAALSVDYVQRGAIKELEPLISAIEELYTRGDDDVLKALNTAYMEDLWYKAKRRDVSLKLSLSGSALWPVSGASMPANGLARIRRNPRGDLLEMLPNKRMQPTSAPRLNPQHRDSPMAGGGT